MKRLLLSAFAALGLAACAMQMPAQAQTRITVDRGIEQISGQRVPAGYEQLTLSTGSSTALASVPSMALPQNPVTLAIFCNESGVSVRFRDDGTAPTAGVGMLLPVGACWTYVGQPAALRFIRVSASSTVLNVLYYY